MRRTGLHAVLVALSVVVSAVIGASSAARAQSASPTCARLESQLAALGGSSGAAAGQLRQTAARLRSELDRMIAESRSLNCERRIFIFGPTPAPQCGELLKRIGKARIDVDRLNSQAAQAQGGNEPMRRQLANALAQNNCGPQYRSAGVPVQRRQAGLLGMLFGGEASEDPGAAQVPEAPAAPAAPARASTFRTVCVRTCDGFFFPVSYTTGSGAFARDEAICQMTCPGAEARLFAYPNPGGAIEQAVSVTGEPYSRLPNAFRYKTEFVSGCSCKPAGMSWADALSGVDDRTLRKGDIVVDEARSEAMSQAKPGPGAPAPAAPATPPPPRAQAPARAFIEPPPEVNPDPGRGLPGEMIISPDMGQ